MKVDFRPDLMTKDIVYCLRSECPRSASCLRYLAYKYANLFRYHQFIDPRCEAIDEECHEYLSNEVQRVGRGFKRAAGLVPSGVVHILRSHISYELSCGRSQYYRYFSGEYPLTVEQQTVVRRVFAEFGVTKEELLTPTKRLITCLTKSLQGFTCSLLAMILSKE